MIFTKYTEIGLPVNPKHGACYVLHTPVVPNPVPGCLPYCSFHCFSHRPWQSHLTQQLEISLSCCGSIPYRVGYGTIQGRNENLHDGRFPGAGLGTNDSCVTRDNTPLFIILFPAPKQSCLQLSTSGDQWWGLRFCPPSWFNIHISHGASLTCIHSFFLHSHQWQLTILNTGSRCLLELIFRSFIKHFLALPLPTFLISYPYMTQFIDPPLLVFSRSQG